MDLSRVKRLGPLVIALVPALWLALRAALEIPFGHDHPTHLFKAWHFWNETLASGRLHGWSRYWAFGAPFDELVPAGGEAWVAGFRALTLGQLSWERTYGLAFGGFLVLKTYAAFAFTRLYFGSAAAVLCAWITLLDPGAMLEGGWEWHTEWGVWPVTLAVSFFLLGLARLELVLRSNRARDVALAGLWFAAALLTHQLVLILLVIAVPALLLDQRLRDEPAPLRHQLSVIGALIFGAALASYFLVPFLARTVETQDLGATGESLATIAQRFAELEVFQNLWRPLQGLSLIGAWLALRTRRAGAIYFSVCAAALVLLSSDILINGLGLERALPTLAKIESNRMLLGAKLFWFPLAGHALVRLARYPIDAIAARPRWQRALALGVPLLIAAPVLAVGARHVYDTQVEKAMLGLEQLPEWNDLQEFIRWSRELRRTSDENYRIAYLFHRDKRHNDLLATVLPVYNQTPMYKVGYTPAQIYKRLPTTDEDALLQAASVKYYLSSYPQERASLILERRFGQFWLYRFRDYRPEPFTLLGPGRAELLELDDERLRIRLSGTSSESRLKLHVASYPRWQARLDGEVVPITIVPIAGADYPILMEVPARDGELELEYVYRAPDWLGLIATLAALPGFFGVLQLERRYAPLERARGWLEARRKALGFALLAAVLAIALVLGLRLRTRERLLPADSLFHTLRGPELALAGEPCAKTAALSFRCGKQRLRAAAVPSEVWGLHLCMSAAQDAGPLTLRVSQRLGSFVAASYEGPRRGGGAIHVVAAGEDLGSAGVRPAVERQQFLAFDTRSLRGREVPLEITVEGGALRCFDLRVVP
jgi:hypothetical protein